MFKEKKDSLGRRVALMIAFPLLAATVLVVSAVLQRVMGDIDPANQLWAIIPIYCGLALFGTGISIVCSTYYAVKGEDYGAVAGVAGIVAFGASIAIAMNPASDRNNAYDAPSPIQKYEAEFWCGRQHPGAGWEVRKECTNNLTMRRVYIGAPRALPAVYVPAAFAGLQADNLAWAEQDPTLNATYLQTRAKIIAADAAATMAKERNGIEFVAADGCVYRLAQSGLADGPPGRTSTKTCAGDRNKL